MKPNTARFAGTVGAYDGPPLSELGRLGFRLRFGDVQRLGSCMGLSQVRAEPHLSVQINPKLLQFFRIVAFMQQIVLFPALGDFPLLGANLLPGRFIDLFFKL